MEGAVRKFKEEMDVYDIAGIPVYRSDGVQEVGVIVGGDDQCILVQQAGHPVLPFKFSKTDLGDYECNHLGLTWKIKKEDI
jgi:hypothetical protein